MAETTFRTPSVYFKLKFTICECVCIYVLRWHLPLHKEKYVSAQLFVSAWKFYSRNFICWQFLITKIIVISRAAYINHSVYHKLPIFYSGAMERFLFFSEKQKHVDLPPKRDQWSQCKWKYSTSEVHGAFYGIATGKWYYSHQFPVPVSWHVASCATN